MDESTNDRTHNPNTADGLAWKRARRRSQRDACDERKKLGRLDSCGLRARWTTHCKRRYQHKRRGSHDGAWRGVTGSHRAIVPGGVALGSTFALIFLEFLSLTMVHGAIHGIAT